MPGDAPSFVLLGSEVTVLHVEPNGAYSLLEWRTPSGSPSPPVHLHRHTDEALYVLSGSLGLLVDERQGVYGRGSFCVIRRGQRHTFWNPGDEVAAYLALVSPPGLERYFAELATGLDRAQSADEARALRQRLADRYDVEVVGPPHVPSPDPRAGGPEPSRAPGGHRSPPSS